MAETSKISPNVNNLAMPRGSLSFAAFDDNGNSTGEVDLGNVTALELTNALEYKDHMTSHESVVVLDAKKISAAKWTVKFSPDELSAENMALFFLGDPDKQKGSSPDRISQTGSNGTLVQDIFLDRWIDLGYKYLKVDSVTLVFYASSIALVNCTLGVDYRIDNENGLVMLLSTNTKGWAEGDSVIYTFKYGSCSLKKFVHRIRPLQGFLRYRGISEVGPRFSIECWKVQIHPDAALGMVKPQDYANLSFTGDLFIDDSTNAHRATDPFFRVAELNAATAYPS